MSETAPAPTTALDAKPDTAAKSPSDRVVSLDQFRGYTVLGMAFVNFLAGYAVIHPVFWHHHTYFSYADAIMPQFFFAVGFAYRLTFLKNLERFGIGSALSRVMQRCIGLLLIGLVVHHFSGSVSSWEELRQMTPLEFLEKACKRGPFQTLTHIAVTSLWVLPVIGLGTWPRVGFAVFSGGLHLGLSFWFNYKWVLTSPVGIDGGPLGFLTWTIPLLAGSFAYDWTRPQQQSSAISKLLTWGTVCMVAAYALSCLNLFFPPNDGSHWFLEPPFVPPAGGKGCINIWTMSQRAGSVTYLLFAAGFAMATYAVFVVFCDRLKWSWSFLATLGGNALVAYILLGMIEDLLHPYTPKDAPLWYVLGAWVIDIGLCWLFLRNLEKHGVRIRM
jgi:predicted acyltransferase